MNKKDTNKSKSKLVNLNFHELEVNWLLTGLRYCMLS